jgi:ATP-dependent Clp protease adaptor protein ClpS
MSTITEKKTQSREILSKPYKLTLHNDDRNSFEHVIESLMKICDHEYEQAAQCASIHNSGKCDVKYGDVDIYNER